MARIAIIDDDSEMLRVISDICEGMGHSAILFHSGEKALASMAGHAPDLVLSDVRMDGMGGMEVLRLCREQMRGIPVILITANQQVEQGIEAMREGAYAYITKPFRVAEVRLAVERALNHHSERKEIQTLRQAVREKYRFENLVGFSAQMQRVFDLIAKVANTDSTILIEGESGTGKELVARALHFNSSRREKPFVAINCSALPDNLLESELFGHKRGAFTGAVADKVGLFEEAEGGTVFLDEVSSMSALMQSKLLRVLQERTLRRVGDTKQIPIHVRVLAATNDLLMERARRGVFREDLYYRLAVIPVQLPALRERVEDIPLLVHHFLQKQVQKAPGREMVRVEDQAMAVLRGYRWPGNVRELENAVERAFALCEGGVIRVRDLPPQLEEDVAMPAVQETWGSAMPVGKSLEQFLGDQEAAYLEATLRMCEGNREKAAEVLGISLATFYRKMEAAKASGRIQRRLPRRARKQGGEGEAPGRGKAP